jgi:flagellar M-ring protein FliF
VQAVLDRVLGPGRAVAKVAATLQFDTVDTTTERVFTDPQAKPLAQSSTTETYTGGAGSAASGVLGTTTTPAVPSGTSTAGGYTKTSATVNNAQSKITENRSATPGSVLRQSVSVIVDTKATGVNLTALQTAITAAAGIDPKRGDVLAVTQMPFDTTTATATAAELKKADAAQQQAQLIGYAKQAAIGLGLLVAFVLFMLKRKKAVKARVQRDIMQLDLLEERATASLPAQRQAIESSSQLPALEAAGQPAGPTPQRRKEDVLALVERQPDEVADLLRGWLADRRG